MAEIKKKQKRNSISEEDISSLLQKYTATTVLALLQEVAQSPGVKLNWDALVKKTSTGISNAREYQMLWRHLAYRDALPHKLDGGAEPLDDDSDLECELEPFPSVSSEASAEAAACVKVLIASGLPSDSSLPNNSKVEAPLTINIPDGQSIKASQNAHTVSSMQGMNITVPVSVPKQNLPAVPSSGALDGNGVAGGNLNKKKRKTWSESEDKELIAAVQKFGVGNWASISRGDFKGDRTPQQLQQRWVLIRKRLGNVNLDGETTNPQLTEAQLATRSALLLALDMPSKPASATNATALKTPPNETVVSSPVEASVQSQNPSQQGPVLKKPSLQKASPVGRMGVATNSRATVNKTSARSCTTTDAILATAVAAGARIASPKTAASLLKVAQSKNAVHVMTSSNSSVRPSMPGSPKQLESHAKHAVHVMTSSTILSDEPLSTRPANTSNTLNPGSVKSASATVGQTQSGSTPHAASASVSSLGMPSEHHGALTSSLAIRFPKEPEVKGEQELQSSKAGCAMKDQWQENGTSRPSNDPVDGVQKHKIAQQSSGVDSKIVAGKNSKDENDLEVTGGQFRQSHNPDDTIDCSLNEESEKKSVYQSMANKPPEAGIVTDNSCKTVKAAFESKAASGT